MNKNLDLARLADLQGSLDKLGDIRHLAHICLAEDGLGAIALNLLDDLLGTLTATRGDVVDYHIGTTLAKKDGDTSTKTANKEACR